MKLNRVLLTSSGFLIMSAIAASSASAENRIIEVQGSVQVEREGTSHYQPVGVGAILNVGDLILPARGARVTVQCSNNTIWSVPAGITSGLGAGCPESVARSRNFGARGGEDFLAFLNHRFVYATQVLEANPVLRWQAVPEAISYQVQVKVGDRTLWQTTVTQDNTSNKSYATRYLGEPLQTGIDYQLIVTAIDRQGNKQDAFLAFRRIDEMQAKSIKLAVAQMTPQDLNTDSKAIALASIYLAVAEPNTAPPVGRGLVMEAITSLESLASTGSKMPYVYRLLGDAYLQVGLLTEATASYQEALHLATSNTDTSERAATQLGLANIAAANGDRRAAGQRLRKARKGYALLGDARQVELVDQWLHKLETP